MKKTIKMYSTSWCSDCFRARLFLKERGIPYEEIDIDQVEGAEEIVLRANSGRRKVPTFDVAGRYFSSSPFDPYRLSEELGVPLNSSEDRK